MQNKDLNNKNILITGSSRGIGASIALIAAKRGANIVINYRTKEKRALRVSEQARAYGSKTIVAQADLTNSQDLDKVFSQIKDKYNNLDVLILNASGGLEKDKDSNYALKLNRDAQVDMVNRSLELMTKGSKIIFITSHLAHFYGEKPIIPGYEPIAESKKAGENALRALIPDLEEKGISLIIVSGDLIEGTITPKLFERASPGLIERRRQQAGALPTTEEFATVIVDAVADENIKTGSTIYVGETDWDLQITSG